MGIDFDDYKDHYRDEVQQSIAFIGQDADFFTVAKVRHLLELAKRHLGDPKQLKLLDVGCGVGSTDRFLIPEVGSLHGVDVSAGSVEKAQAANPAGTYAAYDGHTLPFADASFDLTFAICVMHHVPPPEWPAFAAELARVTRPGGLVAVFEHNPFNPLTRMAVARCEFDADAVLLQRSRTKHLLSGAGLQVIEDPFILFFPFHNPLTEWIEQRLTRLPFGAQYYVAARKRV